jgi:hypothetical protein
LLTVTTQVYELPNLEKHIYAADGLALLPPTLGDVVPRRQTGKEILTEILVADIGDEISKSMYLIVSALQYTASIPANQERSAPKMMISFSMSHSIIQQLPSRNPSLRTCNGKRFHNHI